MAESGYDDLGYYMGLVGVAVFSISCIYGILYGLDQVDVQWRYLGGVVLSILLFFTGMAIENKYGNRRRLSDILDSFTEPDDYEYEMVEKAMEKTGLDKKFDAGLDVVAETIITMDEKSIPGWLFVALKVLVFLVLAGVYLLFLRPFFPSLIGVAAYGKYSLVIDMLFAASTIIVIKYHGLILGLASGEKRIIKAKDEFIIQFQPSDSGYTHDIRAKGYDLKEALEKNLEGLTGTGMVTSLRGAFFQFKVEDGKVVSLKNGLDIGPKT